MRGIAALIAIVAAGMTSYPSDAFSRDPAVRKAFQRANPCPSNGKKVGACPGYVVDHKKPLCAGGQDRVFNMQWQTISEAKKKDRLEAAECRALKSRPLAKVHAALLLE